MRKLILPLSILVLILPLIGFTNANALPTSGSQLFFDDFLTSQVNPAWDVQPYPQGNVSQSGGYLSLINTAAATFAISTTIPNASSYAIVGIAADNIGTSPSISSDDTPSGSFRYMSWKMQPFNITTQASCLGTTCSPSPTGSQLVRNVELDFGLATPVIPSVTNGFYSGAFSFIGWKLVESDSVNSKQALFGQKQSIGIQLFGRNLDTQCFESIAVIEISTLSCGPNNPAINYDGKQPIDLNAQHVFTMEERVGTVVPSLSFQDTWVAFQVDNNAWINVTDAACGCLGHLITPLVPFAQLAYCMGTAQQFSNHSNCANVQPKQSVATSIDWVLVDDYVPASLPVGQLLQSGVIPPSVLPQPGVTGSLTDFIQFEANGIAPGNLYAGGMLLTIIVSGIVFAVLFGLSRRWNIPVKNYGFFFTMFVLVLSFFFFIASVLPIWVPAMMVIITIGIAFGVIRTRSSSGGLVPD